MILFLTSSPTGDLDGKYTCEGFDTRCGFRDQLKLYWKDQAKCLMISAFPENIKASEEMTGFFKEAVGLSGLTCSTFDLLDCRSAILSEDQLLEYDVVFLGGGHVPTQNAFLKKHGLRDKFKNFEGIVIGISAGTMNSADEVYAVPELKGEAVDPDYKRFITGLGLTDINILPHYQMIRHDRIDGLKLFEDIVYPDSVGKEFIAIPDGSFVLQRDGDTKIFGKYYIIKDGVCTPYEG